MEKEILLSLAHNANAQIKNEIAELDDEIIFLNTKLGIDKDNTISNIVKARCSKRKEKKSEELNNFFFKYIMFLLSNKSNDNIGDIDETHFYNMIQKNAEKDGEKNNVLVNQNISNKKRDENFLKCMYKKKDELEQILDLIKLNDLENLSDKASQDIFSNLMLKLKNMDSVKSENILNVEDIDKEMEELNISEKMKQKLLKYLFENINDPYGKTYDLSTAPSTVSLVDTTSEKESDSEGFRKYNNMGLKFNEFFKNSDPTFNSLYTNRSELDGKNNNNHNISYNKKSPSSVSIFLKKGSHNILLNKFNASRKSFSESRQHRNQSCSSNKALMRKKKKKSTNQTKEQAINMSDSNNLIKMHNFENNQNCNNKEKPTSLNNSSPTQGENKNNKNSFSKEKDKNGGFKKVNEDMPSSSSSSSSLESNSIRKFSKDNKTVGVKKLCLKINEKGKGHFTINKKKGKNCSKYIYDFEIVYENDEVSNQNESEKNISEKEKKKNIFHLSFLTNGKKVYKINKLHMKDLKITNDGKSGKISIALGQNKKGLCNSLDSNKEDEDNLSESDRKNGRKRNIWNKYKLKKIGSGYRQIKRLYSKKKDYNIEFNETNKIRGLYIHMLDRQNQLEIEKEFYKKEYDKLQEDVKNNTAPISEYLKEEKLKHFEREKVFYKKEKQFIKKKNLLKKKMLEIESQLEMIEKKLAIEKEKNEKLTLQIQDEKYEIEKRESVNESKIKDLNSKLNQLNKSILLKQKEKDDLLNKLNILKDEDIGFGNFKKNLLDKINKTNVDIKYLAEILEVLTKELEKKNILQNLNEKKIKELEENSQKTENLLRITKDKLVLEKKKKKNLFKEITHLNRKNTELGKCIKDLMLRQNSEINFKENEMNLTGFSSDYEHNQNKKSTLLYDSTSKTNVSLDNDNYNNMLHYKIKYNSNNKKKKNSKNIDLNNSKREYDPSSDKDGTIISDNSSLFLFNPNTKNKISYSDLIESMDDLSDDVTPALKHNIVCSFKAR
ncbi:conserved Plasmodium protein, unknown function [Plasmodium vinckei vinckei]|uniref:Uncharacterized protein n=1 Tax=Plasmodium vinckei vinckei TaxID=54757 RepID=A0A449BR97_PLAVN|nr:conserved Plasmodium protein, unknown function [Plasmodium vinckei vinckei]VEV55964.1 conserved Plasmodium protein, unknown function [Plasmodium vinckei vinckei]